jgi:6-phosphogluconolactonase
MPDRRKELLVATVLGALCFMPGCGSFFSSCHLCPPISSKHFVYTANAAGSPSNVSALSSDAITGTLAAISGSPYNTGSGSVALAADPGGMFLYVANYFSSNISQFTINQTSGSLSPVAGSAATAELGVDSLSIDPTGKFLYAVSDRSEHLWAYSITSTGTLTPLAGTPIAIAPSSTQSSAVVIDPSGKYLYIANHNSLSASLYGFSRNTTTGALSALSGFPVALDGLGNKGTFDPAGKFLLVTGTNIFQTVGGVDVFSLNASTGAVTITSGSPVQARDDPGGIVVDASGKYVYVINTSDVSISEFALDGASGSLAQLSGSPISSGGSGSVNGPLAIAADIAGKFVYVANASNDISVLTTNSLGQLTPITGSPFPAGGNAPSAIVFVP